MKPICSQQRNRAMTLVEVVVVIGGIAFLILWFQSQAPRRGSRIDCTNNLKQLGLAYKIWAGDNNDKYPMDVPVANGGTKELMDTPEAWRAFQVMSNELSTPKVILCPEDSTRNYGTNLHPDFGDSTKNYISYFVGLNASETNPASLLSGDGNFQIGIEPANKGFVNLSASQPLTWDNTRHGGKGKQIGPFEFNKPKTGWGYFLRAEGSVEMSVPRTTTNVLRETGLATNRIFIP